MKKFDLHFGAVCGVALFVGAVVGLGSCSGAEEVMNSEIEGSSGCVPVRVHVSDFSFSVDDFPGTRGAVDPAGFADIKAITLAFYAADGSEVYQSTQVKGSAESFGVFACELPLGSYTLVVVGRNTGDGDVFTLSSPTEAGYTSERARETFCATQSVSITSSSAVDLAVTLNRVITLLAVQSTDVRPAGAVKIRTTYSAGGKTFNPSTGFAIENTGFSVVNTPQSAVGAAIKIGNYAFLASDNQVMDITLDVLDADDNVLITKVVEDVPLVRNRKTTLSGALFTPAAVTIGVRVEEEWLPFETITF